MAVTVVHADERYSHVALSGQLTQFGVERMTGEFYAHTIKRGRDTIVDLADVSFIASAGLGMLAGARKQLRAAGAKIVLLNPNEQARRAIQASRMDILFPIVDSLDDALAALAEDGD